jgi:hypothetical protein
MIKSSVHMGLASLLKPYNLSLGKPFVLCQ